MQKFTSHSYSLERLPDTQTRAILRLITALRQKSNYTSRLQRAGASVSPAAERVAKGTAEPTTEKRDHHLRFMIYDLRLPELFPIVNHKS